MRSYKIHYRVTLADNVINRPEWQLTAFMCMVLKLCISALCKCQQHLEDVHKQKANSIVISWAKWQSSKWLLLATCYHKRFQSSWLGCDCLVMGLYGIQCCLDICGSVLPHYQWGIPKGQGFKEGICAACTCWRESSHLVIVGGISFMGKRMADVKMAMFRKFLFYCLTYRTSWFAHNRMDDFNFQ